MPSIASSGAVRGLWRACHGLPEIHTQKRYSVPLYLYQKVTIERPFEKLLPAGKFFPIARAGLGKVPVVFVLQE